MYQGQERIHWGSFTLHLDPPKQVYHNKSLDELNVQQCTISTCYYHFFASAPKCRGAVLGSTMRGTYVHLNSSTLRVHVHPRNTLHAHVQLKKNGVGLATIDLHIEISENRSRDSEKVTDSNSRDDSPGDTCMCILQATPGNTQQERLRA